MCTYVGIYRKNKSVLSNAKHNIRHHNISQGFEDHMIKCGSKKQSLLRENKPVFVYIWEKKQERNMRVWMIKPNKYKCNIDYDCVYCAHTKYYKISTVKVVQKIDPVSINIQCV